MHVYMKGLWKQRIGGDVAHGHFLPQLPPIPDSRARSSPRFYEVHTAIKGLKNNKSAGPDNLPAEVLKYGGYCLLRRLHHFIVTAWSSGKL